MRRIILLKKILLSTLFLCSSMVYGQQVSDHKDGAFTEFGYRQGSAYRTASGKPGPSYWQNRSDYEIEVELDEEAHTIKGKVTIAYTNNSPEDLEFVWLHLEQNRFTPDSRGTLTTPVQGNRYNGDIDGGYLIENLKAQIVGRNKAVSEEFLISDTRMRVTFAEPIPSNGGKGTISMDFSYKIPEKGMDRMGRVKVKDGYIYALAQWYPKLAVFDDVTGWNTDPYLGAGEFYLGYGDFEFKVTVPYDHIVVASGELVNPGQVLTKEQLRRMKEAMESDERVYIISPEEVTDYASTRPKQEGSLTWHFKMNNTRDVAFASSKAFIWDAARINLPSGKKAMAQSVYPKESDGDEAWGRSTEYGKASVEHYSEMWYEYPYPVAVNVAAEINGMEYPGLNFCSFRSKGASLWGVTDHEFGHNWFPMIVGSNERRHAWMDEGFNTFINYYSYLAFNDGEYTNNLIQTRRYINQLTNKEREPIATHPDRTQSNNLGMSAYMKPALGLIMLREYIIGEERFDKAFKSYINAWAYKHPQPTDFFNHFENAVGENLDWFWKGWFYSNANIDIAIDGVFPYGPNYVVSLSNKGELPMPVLLEITYEDGEKERRMLPVEIWFKGNQWNHLLRVEKKVVAVEIDPDKVMADINAGNDKWPASLYAD
ncbi:Zn-dependent aminopeptidase [Indibacter alkaliphilus LW1]|uniref:Zn-dependent aminopeptidase n=1 Tax=Indibacter alkaliphilus (strain CCUG 57479 / KCTC 22604 / LW1) TaxID=1189612 RepID=S2DTQ7_INDAL|nr:M1 family metallopeptidase [Indibacter alkaliphilus]EOZ93223.1 Zn-dependent aminopeptidase [Indibacter alkaliphilus LW1]